MSHADSLATLLASLPAGKVRLAALPDPADGLRQLEALPADAAVGRLVAIGFDPLPPHSRVIDETLDALADVAGVLWPAWYGQPAQSGPRPLYEQAPTLLHAAELAHCRRRVFDAWVRAADRLCAAGRAPRLLPFGSAREAEQLALTIAPQRCTIVLAVCEADPAATQVLGLARSAEWLAAETGAAILVMVPSKLLHSSDRDSIAFDAVELAGQAEPATTLPGDAENGQAILPHPSQAATSTQFAPMNVAETPAPIQRERRTSRLVVNPLIGLPHPGSPGEQRLAARLAADAALAGLFECNQWVDTWHNTRHLVDLVWRNGRLVIEVDGYRWHTQPAAFVQDRRRDFELTVSGYLVLRLPHDEVMQDVEGAIRRIQELVDFHRGGRSRTSDGQKS